MECIQQVYPSEEVEGYIRMTKRNFKNMRIKIDENEFLNPIRGVGLGYFTNIMVLVIASILQEFNVIKMFSDDIIIDEKHYKDACDELTRFTFVLNEEKTGIGFKRVPYFAGCAMRIGEKKKNRQTTGAAVRFGERNGPLAGVFLAKHHYIRKQIMLSIKFERRWLMCYLYERLFGYEIRRCESFDHKNMFGINTQANDSIGWVKGGIMEKYIRPDRENESLRRFMSVYFPYKEVKNTDFNKMRKSCKKKLNMYHFNEIDRYMNPTEEFDPLVEFKNRIGNYQLPDWADKQMIFAHRLSTGRVTQGHNPKSASRGMLRNSHSNDPLRAWLQGGSNITSYFSRGPYLSELDYMLYELLKHTSIENFPEINKVSGKDALTVLKPMQGLEFMKNVVNSDSQIVVELEIDDSLYAEEVYNDVEEVLDFSDCDEIVYEEEDDDKVYDNVDFIDEDF